MQRRDFLKISAITGASAALDSCGNPEVQLIRFVPEEDLVPGIATWKPSVCTLCPAGCGTLVRVMEGEAEVIRNGKLGLIKMGLAKKLEGNPLHPVNQGKLCPRGQAGLQTTYHPDRLKNPLKRIGPRGSGQFQEASWEEAINDLVAQLNRLRTLQQSSSLAILTGLLRGQRHVLLDRFASAIGAPPPITFEIFDESVLRHANALSFGRAQLPSFDLARSNYVLSFGADFLGTWNSPVAQNIAYGEMRQGRPGTRAKFVQVEPRLSQTGASADEWVPSSPGTEGVLALGLAHVIINEKLRTASSAGPAGALIDGWSQGLPEFKPQEVERRTGVAAQRVMRLAREVAEHEPAVAIIGGAPLAHTNAMFNALAVNALNALLDSVDRPGGIYFTPQFPSAEAKPTLPLAGQSGHSELRALVEQLVLSRPLAPQVMIIYGANPVFGTPTEWRVRAALEKLPYLVNISSFMDETSMLADLILPDHSPLESWLDDFPEAGTPQAVASLAPPAMRPLHNTRAMPDVMLEVAHRLGDEISAALPWKSYEEMLKAAFEGLRIEKGAKPATGTDEAWKKIQEQGGWWHLATSPLPPRPKAGQVTPVRYLEAQFEGTEIEFPLYFQPFPSQLFLDGSLAHLPWMQETPDPLTTSMWGTWVEINPQTAKRLKIQQGDLVEVASSAGKLQAPALISPGIAPDLVAMPVGQGHENFTRYASGRGANPLAILGARMLVPETGQLAWAATRVKIAKVGEGRLALFAGGLREKPAEQEPR